MFQPMYEPMNHFHQIKEQEAEMKIQEPIQPIFQQSKEQ